MLYKTIVLELIQDRPELCARLRSEKLMLRTVESLALTLKTSQQAWQEQLVTTMRGDSEKLIGSRAMELAIRDMIESLPSEPSRNGDEAISLDALIQSVRSPTLPE